MFEYFAHYGVNNIFNSFAYSSGTWLLRKNLIFFFSIKQVMAAADTYGVPRRLLSKFSYSLFFTILTMNVLKLNTNYA